MIIPSVGLFSAQREDFVLCDLQCSLTSTVKNGTRHIEAILQSTTTTENIIYGVGLQRMANNLSMPNCMLILTVSFL